jgi:hypothetical protein
LGTSYEIVSFIAHFSGPFFTNLICPRFCTSKAPKEPPEDPGTDLQWIFWNFKGVKLSANQLNSHCKREGIGGKMLDSKDFDDQLQNIFSLPLFQLNDVHSVHVKTSSYLSTKLIRRKRPFGKLRVIIHDYNTCYPRHPLRNAGTIFP